MKLVAKISFCKGKTAARNKSIYIYIYLNIADVSIRFKRKEIKGDKSSNYFSMPLVREGFLQS